MAQGNRRDEKMRSDRGEWDRKRTGFGNTDKRKKNRRSRPSGRERRAVKKYRLIRSGVLLLFLLTVVLLLRSCIRKVRGTDSMSFDYGTVNVDASEPVIDVQLLDVNPYSRPGTTIDEIHGIVIHYTANPGSTAQENRDYFNGLKDWKGRSSSVCQHGRWLMHQMNGMRIRYPLSAATRMKQESLQKKLISRWFSLQHGCVKNII